MFHFPGQREGEEVLAVIHKHPVVYVKIIAVFILIFILPILLFLYFWFAAYSLQEFYQRGVIVGIFVCLLVLYGLLFTCIRWIDEEFDVFIITTDRLIDVTQITFLKRSVTSTPLEQIQDVTGSISGFLPTILHYGDLTVQTAAGEASDFFIDRISDPEGVARRILDWAHKKRGGEKIIKPS
jgi:uncharacterized membrane protein YdbT with pleckstrin-like domain